MSLLWKVALVLVVLLAVADSSIHHRHHKKGQFHKADDERVDMPKRRNQGDLGETFIHGQIFCNRRPLDWVRPYLSSDLFPKNIINICATRDGGYYRLTTGNLFDLHDSVTLTVRHQCEMQRITPMPQCAVPYYTTTVRIDLSNNASYISRDFELSTMEAYTSSDCLY